MNEMDWRRMARVYRAGAKCARQWDFNTCKQQDADILTAQARECDNIADELAAEEAAESDGS